MRRKQQKGGETFSMINNYKVAVSQKRCKIWPRCGVLIVYQHARCLLLLVFRTFIFHKVV